MKVAIFCVFILNSVAFCSDLSKQFLKDIADQVPQAEQIAINYEKLQENLPSEKDYYDLHEEISKIDNSSSHLLALLKHSIHKNVLDLKLFGMMRPEVPRSYFNLVKSLPKITKQASDDKKLSNFTKYLFVKAQFWDFHDRKLAHKIKPAFNAFKKVLSDENIWTENNHYRLVVELKDLISAKNDNGFFVKSDDAVESAVKDLINIQVIPQWYKDFALGFFYTEKLIISYKFPHSKFDRKQILSDADKYISKAFKQFSKGYIGSPLYQIHMRNIKGHELQNADKVKEVIKVLDNSKDHYPNDYKGHYFGILGNFHNLEPGKLLGNIETIPVRYSLIYLVGDKIRNYIQLKNVRTKHNPQVHKGHTPEFIHEREFALYIKEYFDVNILEDYLKSVYKMPVSRLIGYFGDKNHINAIVFTYFYFKGEHDISTKILKKFPEILDHPYLKYMGIEEHQIGFSHAVTGNAGKLIENIRTLYREPYNFKYNEPGKLKDMIREVEDAKAITDDSRANKFFEYYLNFLKLEKSFHDTGIMKPEFDKRFSLFFQKGQGFLSQNNKVNCNALTYSFPKLFFRVPLKSGFSVKFDFLFKKLRRKSKNIYPLGIFIQKENDDFYAWYDPIKQKAGFTKHSKHFNLKDFYSSENSVEAKFGKKVALELKLENNKAQFIIDNKVVFTKDFDFDLGLVGFGLPHGIFDLGNIEISNFTIK